MSQTSLTGEADIIYQNQVVARVACRLRISLGRGADVTAMGDPVRSRILGVPTISGSLVRMSGTMPTAGERFELRLPDDTTYTLASERDSGDSYRVW